MKLKGKFKNLKTGAKRVFVGMLILCILSSVTGIGSIFVQATEEGDLPEQHTAAAEWSYDDNNHWHVCTVEGCEEKHNDEAHSYTDESYTYTANNNGTHNVVAKCEVCGASVDKGSAACEYVDGVCTYCGAPEPTTTSNAIIPENAIAPNNADPHTHTMSEWTESDGMHVRACTDENCEYTETHAPGGDTTETCTICNPDLLNTYTLDTNSLELLGDTQSISLLGSNLNATSSNDPGGPADFEELFVRLPSPKTGLVYSGAEQDLFDEINTYTYRNSIETKTVEYPGLIYGPDEMKSRYNFRELSIIRYYQYSGVRATNAGDYTVELELVYTYDNRWWHKSKTYTINIAKASFKDNVTVDTESNSYVDTLNASAPYYKLELGGRELAAGRDYEYEGSGDFSGVPTVGESVTYKFKNLGFTDNYDDSVIERTLTVANISPTYVDSSGNESTEPKAIYKDEVTVIAPNGYSILGTDNKWGNQATFTSTPSDQYLFFRYEGNYSHKKVKVPVKFRIVDSSVDYILDDLMTTYPQLYSTMTYTGSDLTLMSVAPEFISDSDLAELGITDLSYEFRTNDGMVASKNMSPIAADIGVHVYTFSVIYTKDGSEKTITLPGYVTEIDKEISHPEITYTAGASDYQTYDSSKDIKDFYSVKDLGLPDSSQNQLQRDVHYTVEVSPVQNYYETGNPITLTYTGVTKSQDNVFYKGTTTKTIPVSTVNVKLNGAAQVEKYNDAVTFTADGYTISDKADGTFDISYTYSVSCDKIDLPLYFKKNGKIVKQTIKDLTIGNAAGIKLLYDGSSELKPLYHDTVRISADGYTVSATQTGTFSDSYVLSYDASKNMTPVDSFSLYFKDKNTGSIHQKSISGINLIKTPNDITVLYNGASQKDWYNANVTITGTEAGTTNKCTISDSKDGTYTGNYVMTGSGLVSKKLYFKNSAGTVLNDGNPYTIVVNIDKTAPTGTITLNGATSSSFKSTDSTVGYANSSQKASISASDDVSGVETIKYYASETFYSSSSDLIAGMSEKSGAWRTYSSSSAPQLVKDKNNYIYVAITDKAGNTGYISLGAIVYDTVAPTVTTATVTDSADGKSKVLVIAGTDDLSGINRFKLMYFEKDNTHQPSKDEIFNMGTYISASASSGKEAGATYTIEGLESGKTYVFYVASVDRAGNISDVKAIEGEGTTAAEAAAAKAAADAAAAQAAASSALAAAPNGLAGGNSGQPTTSPEASANSQSGSSGEEEGEEERVISREPYIAEATGSTQIGPINTSGWDKIKGEIRKADNGTQMSVEMSGVSEIPLSVLKEVADRDDLEVTFLINDGVEWTIKGSSITEEGIKTVDLGVKMGSKNIPAKVSNDVVGSYQHVDFAVNEEGELGFTATISVPVGTSNAGMNATLYYYNPKKNELEAVKASVVDDNGRAKFDMTHCSDYTIVITPEKLLSDSEVSYSVTRSDTLTSEEIFDGTKIRLADLFGVSGGGRIWLFVIAAISAALCVAILYFPGLQKEEGN